MAEPTSSLTFLDLYGEVGWKVYGDRAPTGADGVNAKLIANLGYGDFIDDHDWAFLTPSATIALWPTTTGTATTIATVTVTADAAMFYDSMIGYNLTFDTTENDFVIASVTSTTVAVMETTAAGESATDTLTITSDGSIRLPDDFGYIKGSFHHEPSEYGGPEQTTLANIRELRARGNLSANYPGVFAIEPESGTPTRYRAHFWPNVSTLKTLYYQYRVGVAEMTSDTEVPLGAQLHKQTILAACLKKAEEIMGQTTGVCREQYERRLAASRQLDWMMRPKNLGNMRFTEPVPQVRTFTDAATYNT